MLDLNFVREHLPEVEERLRAQYLKAVGLTAVPSTLAEYLNRVVTPTLERQKSDGAVAETGRQQDIAAEISSEHHASSTNKGNLRHNYFDSVRGRIEIAWEGGAST